MRISSEIVRVCKNDLYNHSNVQFPPIQNEIFHNFLINNFRTILFNNNKNPLIYNSNSTIPFVSNYDTIWKLQTTEEIGNSEKNSKNKIEDRG